MGTSGLGALLVEEGLLTELDRRTIKRSCGSEGSAFARGIVAMGLLDEDELAAFLAERTPWHVAPKELFKESRQDVWGIIDRPLVERLEVLPLKLESGTLHVAVVDPLDQDTLRQLSFFTGYKIHPVISTISEIRAGLAKLLKGYQPRTSQLEQFLANHAGAASRTQRLKERRGTKVGAVKARAVGLTPDEAFGEDVLGADDGDHADLTADFSAAGDAEATTADAPSSTVAAAPAATDELAADLSTSPGGLGGLEGFDDEEDDDAPAGPGDTELAADLAADARQAGDLTQLDESATSQVIAESGDEDLTPGDDPFAGMDDPFAEEAAELAAAAAAEPDPFAGMELAQATTPPAPAVDAFEPDTGSDTGSDAKPDTGPETEPATELEFEARVETELASVPEEIPVAPEDVPLEMESAEEATSAASGDLDELSFDELEELDATAETAPMANEAMSGASNETGDATDEVDDALLSADDLESETAAPSDPLLGIVNPSAPLSETAALNRALVAMTMVTDGAAAVGKAAPALVGAGLVRGIVLAVQSDRATPVAAWEQQGDDVRTTTDGLGPYVTATLGTALTRLFAGWSEFDTAREKDLKPFTAWTTPKRALYATLLPAGDQRQMAVITAWDESTRHDGTIRTTALEVFRRVAQKL